jgi:uncharacterized membrane protein YqiK
MEPIFIAVGVATVLILGLFAMFAKFYRKIEQGHALIVNTLRDEPEVTFTGRMVYPIIHKAELMEISLKTVEIDRSGNEGLICKREQDRRGRAEGGAEHRLRARLQPGHA